MDQVFGFLIKLLVFIVLAPLLVCLALQLVAGFIAAVLPWLIAFAVIVGVVAGLSAGLVLRRRLPPRNPGGSLPYGSSPIGRYSVKRPRGVRGRDQGD